MKVIELYDFQKESVEALRENIRRGVKNQILSAATGSGKTVIAAYLLNECHTKMRRAIFVCDRISLINQTSELLDEYGVPHGVIQAQHWRWRPWERIHVASAATLEKRSWPTDTDLIIVDEAHCIRKHVTDRISKRDCITIGLTATPFTKGLGKLYDAIVTVTTTNKLIGEKYLAPFRIFAASEPNMTGAKIVAGEWTDDAAAERAMPIVGDCVSEYLKHGENKKFICFGVNVAHCEEMQKQMLAAGVQCALYTYRTGDEERTEMVREFRKPDSYIRGLISVAALSKGFDVSDVEVIIMARPLKSSFAEHVQILGRGLRSHAENPEKVCTILDHAGNCIAGGQRVLTQRGLVPIELILISDTLWDGHEFVHHKGVISRGKKKVIQYGGLTATEDHQVKTNEGWSTLGVCAKKQTPIITTGIGRKTIRECENYFTAGGMARTAASTPHARALRMRDVWVSVDRFVQQLKRWADSGLQAVQRSVLHDKESGCRAAMAVSTSEVNATPLHEPQGHRVCNLWRQGDRVQIQDSSGVLSLDREEYWPPSWMQRHGIGPLGQRGALRAREHPVGVEPHEQKQHAHHEMGAENARLQISSSGGSVRGCHVASIPVPRVFVRPDCVEIQPAIEEAEREVWDILDAGPRNSFTCEGLLVHNCVRFWGRMNEFFEDGASELDDGKHKEKKKLEPKDKEPLKCPKCFSVHAPAPRCPSCGYEYPRRSNVEHVAGDLIALTGGNSATREDKQDVWSQLRFIASERGYKPGWASHKYRERFGVWPQGLVDVEKPPTQLLKNWILSRQIAWAKGRR